ncbi:MAG: SpoIIIAC/SpoIIIAD family protein [Oscillospiraceae bacterium]
MDRFLQAAALAMVGAVLALVVQKQAKEISILMVIACSAVILALAAWFLEPVVDFVTELRLLGQLDGATVTILLKTAGVGPPGRAGRGGVAEDAGRTLAKMVRLCGSAAALYLALPLLTSVLDMIGDMLKVKPCGSG